MIVSPTDTKTDTRLWFWGSFRNVTSSLDYSVEGGILNLQTRQTQPDSVPRLHSRFFEKGFWKSLESSILVHSYLTVSCPKPSL